MKVAQRIDLIEKIACELQSRYTLTDIDVFLSSYKIQHPAGSGHNSKRLYVKEALSDSPDDLLITLSQDLDMDINSSSLNIKITTPPGTWKETKDFKLFISHLAIHKNIATKLKSALRPYKISSFVAHKDISPTLPWQMEIEKALHVMDAMVCIHTEGFSKSPWTQQEIGFGICKGIKIISLKMDEDPEGFISKDQAMLRANRDAIGVAEEINEILVNDSMTKDKMNEVRSMSNK